MLTIDALKELGADVATGVARCAGKEDFYLKMVTMALSDSNSFVQLQVAVDNKSLDEAFERAHGLKGVLGNLSLTNLYEPVAEMTEELRARKDIDYSGYMATINAEYDKYRALL